MSTATSTGGYYLRWEEICEEMVMLLAETMMEEMN